MRAKGVRSTFGGLGSTKVETCVGRIERKEFQVHTAVVVQAWARDTSVVSSTKLHHLRNVLPL